MKLINSLKDIQIDQNEFPLFFWSEWKQLECELHNKQYWLCADENNNVVAFTTYQMKFFKKADYLYVPLNCHGERLFPEDEQIFLNKFHSFLKQCHLADIIFPPSHVVVFKSIPHKVIYFDFGILHVDLIYNEETLIKKISKANRKKIRNEKNNDLETSLSDVNNFYSCYFQSMKKNGFNIINKDYFTKYQKLLPQNTSIIITKSPNTIEATEFLIYDKKNAYGLYPGINYQSEYKNANKFHNWQIYKKLQSNNIQNYILGGFRPNLRKDEKLYNIQQFKKEMGAETEMGYHFIKVICPLKYFVIRLVFWSLQLLTNKNYSFINFAGLELKKS